MKYTPKQHIKMAEQALSIVKNVNKTLDELHIKHLAASQDEWPNV
tara:strand:+ start:414 stop:548 length:135 start_codon:yes stop_codon:yes gene_type:complete